MQRMLGPLIPVQHCQRTIDLRVVWEKFVKRRQIRSIVGMLALFISSAVVTPTASADEPHWLTDWEVARTLARKTGKPIFVVFRCEH
jgi:hypothetical protein